METKQQIDGGSSRGPALTRITSGAWVLALGVLHNLVGLTMGLGWLEDPAVPDSVGRAPLLEIIGDGVVDAVQPDLLRMVFFWFIVGGCLLMMLGSALRQAELRGAPPTRAQGIQLIAFGLGGGILIPASGFWLAIPVGLRLARRRRTVG